MFGSEPERNTLRSYVLFSISLYIEKNNCQRMNEINVQDIKEKRNPSEYTDKGKSIFRYAIKQPQHNHSNSNCQRDIIQGRRIFTQIDKRKPGKQLGFLQIPVQWIGVMVEGKENKENQDKSRAGN